MEHREIDRDEADGPQVFKYTQPGAEHSFQDVCVPLEAICYTFEAACIDDAHATLSDAAGQPVI